MHFTVKVECRQRCHSTVSCHRYHTNVHIVISALSLPLLFRRCHCQRCNIADQHRRCHNAVFVFTATTLCSFSLSQHCTSVSNRFGVAPVYKEPPAHSPYVFLISVFYCCSSFLSYQVILSCSLSSSFPSSSSSMFKDWELRLLTL